MIRNTLPKAYAGIELGNGGLVEITDSAVTVRCIGGYARSNGSRSPRVKQVVELAKGLQELRATPDEVDRVAADQVDLGVDDYLVEAIVSESAELIPRDREKAYYLLSLTYGMARRYATMWKHALVGSVLGFFVLYARQCPQEATPIFEDLAIVSRIIGSYLGCSENARGLYQLACRGLDEAHKRADGLASDGPADSDLSGRVWSAIRKHSAVENEHDLFMQSEAFARAMLLLEGGFEKSVAAKLCAMGKSYLATMQNDAPLRACLPVVTLAEVLNRYGAQTEALELLECVRVIHKDWAPLMQLVLANRMAAIWIALDDTDTARQLLSSVPIQALAGLAGHSITAQGEMLLFALNRAQSSSSQGGEGAVDRWTKEAIHHLRTLEQWSQISSRVRKDDLRLLYSVILRDLAHDRLASLRSPA